MENIHILPTAKEFIRSDKGDNLYIISDGDESNIAEIMIEFAKLHAEAALKAASKRVTCSEETQYDENDNPVLIAKINRDSILDAYPLTNIK